MNLLNMKIAAELLPDFDARDTGENQVDALMTAVREESLARITALETALETAHRAALTSKGYPTVQSEAVRAHCEAALGWEITE